MVIPIKVQQSQPEKNFTPHNVFLSLSTQVFYYSGLKGIVSTGRIISGVESEQKLILKRTEKKCFGDGKHGGFDVQKDHSNLLSVAMSMNCKNGT